MVVQFLLCLSLYAESALVNGPSASMLHVPWMCVNAEAVTAVFRRRKGRRKRSTERQKGTDPADIVEGQKPGYVPFVWTDNKSPEWPLSHIPCKLM